MRADTQTISIDVPPQQLLTYVANPENLPRWAVGFAKTVRRQGDGWVVETGAGDMALRIEADATHGTVDYWLSPATGVSVLAASRVIPRGAGSEYVFTQFQAPGMPDEVFTKSISALRHELAVLRALLEVECPL